MNEEYKFFFDKINVFKECKQPHQEYILAEEQTLNKTYVNNWEVYYDNVGDVPVRYICENQLVKFVFFSFDN